MRPLILAIGISLAWMGAAVAQDDLNVERIAGCYELETEAWSPPYRADRQTFPLPAIVRLRSELAEGRRGGAHGRAVDAWSHDGYEPLRSRDGFKRWSVHGDSIVIHLNAGTDGYQFFLEASAGETPQLEGSITAWDEWSGADPSARVLLSGVSCDSVLSISLLDPPRRGPVGDDSKEMVEETGALRDLPYGVAGGAPTYLLFRQLFCAGQDTGLCGFESEAFAIGFPIGFVVGLGIGSSLDD
ncbi:MAG: hypothetical protein R3326_04145 [Gemmatimonadota bacterium]|nr:hypothetical protein [Gemmatimonadota bacterium]